MAVSAASAMSLKRSFSSFSCGTCVRCSDARARRARRSALRRRAQPSNKEDQKVAVSAASAMSLKDTSLPPSPPAPSIDGRTLFNLETLLIATKMKAEAEAQEAQNVTTMKTEAEVSPEGLATLAQPLADKTTTDKTSPILNDLGPVALPRIGKEERKEALEEFRKGKGKSGGARGEGASDKRAVALEARERLGKEDTTYWEQEGCRLAHRLASRLAMPCPRHRQAGRRAGPHQYLSKPFHCGCCVGTCELCEPAQNLWSPSFSPTTDSDLAFGADPFGDGAASEDLPQLESQPDSEGEPFYCELYPHCGCDPTKDRVAMLDTPYAMLE